MYHRIQTVTPPSGSGDLCDPLDVPIGEDIVFVRAASGKLGDDRALVAGLEPVQGVRRDGVLIAGIQGDLVPDGVSALSSGRRATGWGGSRRPFDVEIDRAPSTAEGLLLSRVAADGRMTVLRAALPGPHRQLLGA